MSVAVGGWQPAQTDPPGNGWANTDTPASSQRTSVPGMVAPIMGNGVSQPTASGDSTTPSYLGAMFPNGLPQAMVATAGQTQPVYSQSAMQMMNGSLDPGALTAKIMAALQPEFAQQQHGLTESLANAGIVGGSTAGAEGDLARSQTTQAAATLAPFEQTANAQRLAGWQSDTDAALRAAQGNQAVAQQGNQFDASSLNSGNEFNIANLIKGGMYDTSNFNSMQQFIDQMQNTDWLQQLGIQGQLATAGAGAQSAAYQPVFQQPATANFSGLASAFAPSATSQPAPLSPQYTP